MKYTADTGFFIRLSQGDKRAQEIWKEICEGKGRLLIPAPVLVETTRDALRKGKKEQVELLYNSIKLSSKLFVADLTAELARSAGILAFTYGISSTDGCVLSTAIVSDFKTVLTTDTHFRKAKKEGKIELVEL